MSQTMIQPHDAVLRAGGHYAAATGDVATANSLLAASVQHDNFGCPCDSAAGRTCRYRQIALAVVERGVCQQVTALHGLPWLVATGIASVVVDAGRRASVPDDIAGQLRDRIPNTGREQDWDALASLTRAAVLWVFGVR